MVRCFAQYLVKRLTCNKRRDASTVQQSMLIIRCRYVDERRQKSRKHREINCFQCPFQTLDTAFNNNFLFVSHNFTNLLSLWKNIINVIPNVYKNNVHIREQYRR